MKTVQPSRLLRFALSADALITGAVAALQLAAPDALSQLLMLPRALLVETGVFMVGYTALLLVLAGSSRVASSLIWLIVVGNAGWAVGCVGIAAFGLVSPGALGLGYLAIQAVAVLVFAVMEGQGLRTSLPGRSAGAVQVQ